MPPRQWLKGTIPCLEKLPVRHPRLRPRLLQGRRRRRRERSRLHACCMVGSYSGEGGTEVLGQVVGSCRAAATGLAAERAEGQMCRLSLSLRSALLAISCVGDRAKRLSNLHCQSSSQVIESTRCLNFSQHQSQSRLTKPTVSPPYQPHTAE